MVVILLFALDKGSLLLRRMVGFEGRPAPSISRLFSAASNFNALGPHNFGLIAATRVCQVSLGRFGLRSMRCRSFCFSEVGAGASASEQLPRRLHQKRTHTSIARFGDVAAALFLAAAELPRYQP